MSHSFTHSLYRSLSLPPALDEAGQLTDPLGIRMAEFPLNPMFARIILQSGTPP